MDIPTGGNGTRLVGTSPTGFNNPPKPSSWNGASQPALGSNMTQSVESAMSLNKPIGAPIELPSDFSPSFLGQSASSPAVTSGAAAKTAAAAKTVADAKPAIASSSLDTTEMLEGITHSNYAQWVTKAKDYALRNKTAVAGTAATAATAYGAVQLLTTKRANAKNIPVVEGELEPQLKSRGGIIYASNGALINAQQGTDSVPAMLTPGEFVVNKQAAQRHMPVLNAINSGHYAHGGVVQYLASGGVVQPKYLADAGIVNNIANSSSQSGVLTNTSTAMNKAATMEKPSWVDEFFNRLGQGGSTLVQAAATIANGAGNFVSGAKTLSEVSLPSTIALNGNFNFTPEAIGNIIGRSVGESVSVSNANSAQQVAASESSTSRRLAHGTDYAIS
jgi:hypothetical protein